jgi:hypothetical protein
VQRGGLALSRGYIYIYIFFLIATATLLSIGLQQFNVLPEIQKCPYSLWRWRQAFSAITVSGLLKKTVIQG